MKDCPMSHACRDCDREHPAPTNAEVLGGTPCFDAMARDRDSLKLQIDELRRQNEYDLGLQVAATSKERKRAESADRLNGELKELLFQAGSTIHLRHLGPNDLPEFVDCKDVACQKIGKALDGYAEMKRPERPECLCDLPGGSHGKGCPAEKRNDEKAHVEYTAQGPCWCGEIH